MQRVLVYIVTSYVLSGFQQPQKELKRLKMTEGGMTKLQMHNFWQVVKPEKVVFCILTVILQWQEVMQICTVQICTVAGSDAGLYSGRK